MKPWDWKLSARFRQWSLYIFVIAGPLIGEAVLRYQDIAPNDFPAAFHISDLFSSGLIYVYWLGSIPAIFTWMVFLMLCYAAAPALAATARPWGRLLFAPVIGLIGATAGVLGGGMLMAMYANDGREWVAVAMRGREISAFTRWLLYSAWSPGVIASFCCAVVSSLLVPVMNLRSVNVPSAT